MFEVHDTAVLPVGSESAPDAQSIATVQTVENNFVVLMDGRTFVRRNGDWISEDGTTHILPASKQHIDAVHRRSIAR